MTTANLPPWDQDELRALNIICHFIFTRTEDAKHKIAGDEFLPLAGALAGLQWRKSSEIWWKLLSNHHPDWPYDDLITPAIQAYQAKSEIKDAKVIAIVTRSNKEYRAFCECLRDDGTYRIDISLAASAAFAYLALPIAHIIPLDEGHYALTDQQRSVLHGKLRHYFDTLNMIAIASRDGGTIVVPDHHIEPAHPQLVNTAISIFRYALAFVVFHELAHIELGHHAARAADSSGGHKAQEYEADRLALTRLIGHVNGEHKAVAFLSAVTPLLAASLMSSGEDDIPPAASHPSHVGRFVAMCALNDQLNGQESGYSYQLTVPFLTNLLANVHDRDRCPAWLQLDRLSALGLPADLKEPVRERKFESMPEFKTIDLGKSPARSRKIVLF